MTIRPSELPHSWIWADLGEIAEIKGRIGWRGLKKHEYTREGPILLSIGNITASGEIDFSDVDHLTTARYEESPEIILLPGDIIMAKDGTLGKVALVSSLPCETTISSTLAKIRPKEAVDSKYLFYFFRTGIFATQVLEKKLGTAVQHFVQKRMKVSKVPLAPVNEQRRIVAKVEGLLVEGKTAREALDKVPVLLRRFRQSVLAKAFRGELTQRDPNDEPAQKLLERIGQERHRKSNLKKGGKYKQPLTPDGASLPKLPSNWCWATIDQLSIVVRGASPRPAGDPRFFGGNIPWITVGSLTADEQPHLETARETVTEAGREASRYIEPHTLLLTNSGATLGVPKITLIGGCINDGIVGLLHVNYPLKSYLYYFLKSQTKRLRDINQGAAQPNLNTDIIRAIQVPIPPLNEQNGIVARIEGLFSLSDRIEIDVKKAKEKTDSVDRAILAKAFRGELVPQDPNDEPASILLQHLRSIPKKDGTFQTKSAN